jgi:GAF domain-containing protein
MDWLYILITLSFIVVIAPISLGIYSQKRMRPIEKLRAVEIMSEGVLVLDRQDAVIDFNVAARKILSLKPNQLRGQPAHNVIPNWPDSLPPDRETFVEITLGTGQSACTYDLLITPQATYNRLTGRLVILRDITERKHAGDVLRYEQEMLARRSAQLAAVTQVARQAAGIHDLDKLLDQTTQLISEYFGYYHAGIFLLDPVGDFAILEAASSRGGQKMLTRQHKLRVGSTSNGNNPPVPIGIVGTVAKTGQPRIALDVGQDAVYFDNPDLPETHSEMALPLKIRERIIGVLDVQSTVSAAFTEEDANVLQALVDQIALAIDNVRLLQENQKAVQEIKTLYQQQVGQAWNKQLTGRLLAFTYDATGVKPADASLVKTGFPENGSTLEVPLVLRTQKLGSLVLCREGKKGNWSVQEQILVKETVNQIVLALENARLLAETQRRAERERLITEITSHIRETLDIDTILQTAAREFRQVLGLNDITIRLGDVESRKMRGLDPLVMQSDNNGVTYEPETHNQ